MTKPEQSHVAVRLDTAILARVDALAPLVSTAWHTATRSDVLRALLLTSLDEAEKDPAGFKARNFTSLGIAQATS